MCTKTAEWIAAPSPFRRGAQAGPRGRRPSWEARPGANGRSGSRGGARSPSAGGPEARASGEAWDSPIPPRQPAGLREATPRSLCARAAAAAKLRGAPPSPRPPSGDPVCALVPGLLVPSSPTLPPFASAANLRPHLPDLFPSGASPRPPPARPRGAQPFPRRPLPAPSPLHPGQSGAPRRPTPPAPLASLQASSRKDCGL